MIRTINSRVLRLETTCKALDLDLTPQVAFPTRELLEQMSAEELRQLHQELLHAPMPPMTADQRRQDDQEQRRLNALPREELNRLYVEIMGEPWDAYKERNRWYWEQYRKEKQEGRYHEPD